MERLENSASNEILDSEKSTQKESKKFIRRPRSLTTLKLEVIAERARKIKRLKDSILEGKYRVKHSEVAEALIKNSAKQF